MGYFKTSKLSYIGYMSQHHDMNVCGCVSIWPFSFHGGKKRRGHQNRGLVTVAPTPFFRAHAFQVGI